MLYYQSPNQNFSLHQGDCLAILPTLADKSVNMIFADPPYFLSNDGLTIKNGRIQSVNKGEWDRADLHNISQFNHDWLTKIRQVLTDNGTIWISGTHHNIFIIGQLLNELGFKILNIITWEKPNPPPNFSCRYFTNSAEWIIWARKHPKIPHYFDYDLMKRLNGDKQMKDIWRLPAVTKWEKEQGKHPTQKPLGLLSRIVFASTQKGDLVLDPFAGSSTTGITCLLLDRRFIGIEKESEFLALSKRRFDAINERTKKALKQKVREQISLI